MQDSVKKGHYFIKAKVMASYRVNVMYDVTATLSQLSGFVCDASCTCVASAMGRCSHVTALLYALVDYNEKSDSTQTDPQLSCTSLPCTWNQGRKKNKQPKKVQDSVYSTKKTKITEVINFDPRAPSTIQSSEKEANKCMLWSLGKFKQTNSMWMSLLQHQYDDYELDDDRRVILKQHSALLLENLKVPSKNGFPFELVKVQGSDEWYSQRRVRITASMCKTTLSLKSMSAISNHINKQLWSTEKVTTCALDYGTKNEPVARQAYQHSQDSENLQVIETGFWVNGAHPELAASPDGLILDLTEPTRYGILELKCPKILEDKNISDFNTVLSAKQSSRFCLEHSSDGVIVLKKTHPYYYQIQMQMGVTGLKFCDFVVWSSKETLVKRVRFDEEFWSSLKMKLIEFHHLYICPEIFEMRIPRELVPFKLV